MGGARVAQEFFGAVTQINQAGLVLAHTAGGGQRLPGQAVRIELRPQPRPKTWALEQNAMEQVELAKGTLRFQPDVIKIEARNMKRNNKHQRIRTSSSRSPFQAKKGSATSMSTRRPRRSATHKDLILEVLEQAKGSTQTSTRSPRRSRTTRAKY